MLQFHVSGLDLRKIQDVVEQAQQTRRRVVGHLRQFPLIGVQARIQQQRRHPQHAVHRRANLMTHVGDEFALGATGVHCPGLRAAQLVSLRLEFGLLFLDFRLGFIQLTGMQVQDASLLNLPAVLVSISNMPPTARPQAGLSFAPWVYELFIGEGTTRFLSVFYAGLPRRIPNDGGTCNSRENIFQPDEAWLGRRVWLDENENGTQEPWEAGVGGICVSLHDALTGTDYSVRYADCGASCRCALELVQS